MSGGYCGDNSSGSGDNVCWLVPSFRTPNVASEILAFLAGQLCMVPGLLPEGPDNMLLRSLAPHQRNLVVILPPSPTIGNYKGFTRQTPRENYQPPPRPPTYLCLRLGAQASVSYPLTGSCSQDWPRAPVHLALKHTSLPSPRGLHSEVSIWSLLARSCSGASAEASLWGREGRRLGEISPF